MVVLAGEAGPRPVLEVASGVALVASVVCLITWPTSGIAGAGGIHCIALRLAGCPDDVERDIALWRQE